MYSLRLATMLTALAMAIPVGAQLKIHVEVPETDESAPGALWVEADFSGEIKASINKFVPMAQLVSEADDATVVLRHTATIRSRGESTAKQVFIGRGAAARASAELVDACGTILWSEAAKDTSRLLGATVGDFAKSGPSKVADRIAKRLKEALRKGKVKPCSPE